MTILITLSIISFGLSIVSCTWSLIVTVKLNALQGAIRRVNALEESVVRSVMEEGGEASAEAVLRTAERIAKIGNGMAAGTAFDNAMELHKKRV